ncbi:MAG: PAS domain S-box protein [Methanomicrobia archaeon]|nr:PAS domain S-box protein [Methanomicrobia archaeon]
MPQNELKKASSEENKLKIIAIAVTLCVAITLYFRIIEVKEVYTHLFYIPIGLASFWFGKKGFFVALILALVLLLTHLTMDQLFLNNVMRAFMFCIVGLAVGILSEARNKAENELKKYSERLEEKVEERTKELKESKNKIEQLHKVAVQMESTQLEEEVYQLTVDAAEKILEFDMCTLDVVEGNQFVVKATSSELPLKGTVSSSVDEGGMAAKTYRTGKSYLTKDLRKEKEARPSLDEYRSGISIPIGKFGVFQAVSTEVDAFDQEDLELGELLISHTTEALKRIRSEKALQESEEKYKSLTNQLPVGVYRTTGDGKFLHANPALAAILEFESVEDLMKISASDVYNDPRERINQIRQWKTTKEIISNELKFRTKKGREIWIRDTGRVILDENGEISYIDGVIEDITDRKKVEELLKKQREELSAFAHTVSHDLKNYIGIIRNSAQFSLLKKEYAEKNNQRIIDITKKMENFVNRQLELADAGKAIGELEEIDLNKMIDEVRETYSIEIHRGELSMIKGDSLKLKEVFHNLIDNAIKHGKADKIEISSIKKKNSCIIYVKDNGKGIPEEDIDKIFDMRYSKTGTGFGLTIAKKIIEAHDGSISVKSKEGEGTAFEIVLPI